MTQERIIQHLFSLQDVAYRNFLSKLLPTIPEENIIGVRTPALRKLAKEIAKDTDTADFLNSLPHRYFEENQLHAFLICEERDAAACFEQLQRFLPYLDNWATCDQLVPKCFRKSPTQLLPGIKSWLSSGHTYTVRYGIGTLMRLFSDELFDPVYLQWVAEISSEEYYVNMMIAWYFATLLAKQYDTTIPYLQQHILSPWVHRKTIQKARESFRISPQQKDYLATLR